MDRKLDPVPPVFHVRTYTPTTLRLYYQCGCAARLVTAEISTPVGDLTITFPEVVVVHEDCPVCQVTAFLQASRKAGLL